MIVVVVAGTVVVTGAGGTMAVVVVEAAEVTAVAAGGSVEPGVAGASPVEFGETFEHDAATRTTISRETVRSISAKVARRADPTG
ncbi:MAG: hypothetical protein OEX97_03560 [Acidimicrobiia bacterium]|nr:hypothetical protein [Acidimicrobiia bacterium]